MPKLIMMCGPPGSGKSTLAKSLCSIKTSDGKHATYINQDSQRGEHMAMFDEAIIDGDNIVVDRMSFNKAQRSRYLTIAKNFGYQTEIRILHQPYEVCLERILKREGHETITDEKSARSALDMFFGRFEEVSDDEADTVIRVNSPGDQNDRS